MTLLLNPKYAHLSYFLSHIDENFKHGGHTIHEGRNCLKIFEINGLSLCVKHYGDLPFHTRLMPLIHRMPKGKKAFMRPFELRELGIDSPEPVAYISLRRNLTRHSTYFVCLKSTCTHTLLEGMGFEDEARKKLCLAFTKYLAHLHDIGFLPRDLNASDVFFDQCNDRYHFALIDTNSILRKRKIKLKKGVRNYAQFFTSDSDCLAFINHYAEARGFDKQVCKKTLESKE